MPKKSLDDLVVLVIEITSETRIRKSQSIRIKKQIRFICRLYSTLNLFLFLNEDPKPNLTELAMKIKFEAPLSSAQHETLEEI